MKLSSEEIASITSEKGIRVSFKGTDKYTVIVINKAPSLPEIYANDDMNKVFGMDDDVYYSINNGETWTKYKDQGSLPDLSGDLKFMVQISAQGKTLGSGIKTFNFSSKVDNSIILPSSINDIKATSDGKHSAKAAYDGNIYSY